MAYTWKSSLKPIIAVVSPIVLLPLPLLNPGPIAGCGYVALLMATFWITEAIPSPITSLLPLALFPLTGVMTSREVSKSYFVDVSWFVVGALILVVAVEDSGLHKRIALRFLLLFGTNRKSLLFSFMLITFLISMWMSNTACAAMILPIANAVIKEVKKKVENADESATIYSNPDIEVIDIPTIDDSNPPALSEIIEIQPPSNNNESENDLIKMERGIFLGISYAANIGGSACLIGSPSNIIIAAQFQNAFPRAPPLLTFGNWIAFGLPFAVLQFSFAYFWIAFLHLGFKCKCVGICKKTENVTKALLRKEYEKLGPMKWAEGSVLLIFVVSILLWYFLEPGLFVGLQVLFQPNYVSYGTISIGVTILLFILPRERPSFLRCCKDSNNVTESSDMEYKSILQWSTVQSKFPWGLFLLVGGGFALVDGAQQSGLAVWFGKKLEFLEAVQPWGICLVLIIIMAIITETITTSTLVTLFVPILSQLAVAVNVNPLYLALTPNLACSLSYMLPVSAPSNALIYSYGKVTMHDMFKAGIIIKIFGILGLFFIVNGIASSLFDFKEFPDWALSLTANATTNATDSTTLN